MRTTLQTKILETLEKYRYLPLKELEKKLNNYSRYVYVSCNNLVALGLISKLNDGYVFGSPDDIIKQLTNSTATESTPKGLPFNKTDVVKYAMANQVVVTPRIPRETLAARAAELCDKYVVVLSMMGLLEFRDVGDYDNDAAVAKLNTIIQEL